MVNRAYYIHTVYIRNSISTLFKSLQLIFLALNRNDIKFILILCS